jgi:hypothetical protein
MEYLILVDDVQEDLVQAMANGGDCAPVTDYYSYANREWLTTDTLAINITYGRCTACPATNSSLKINVEVCDAAEKVKMTGPFWNWDTNNGPSAEDNGDGTWTFTFDEAPAEDMEYLIVVDDVQENLIQAMVDGGDCAPVTDYYGYANREWLTTDPMNVYVTYGKCSSCTPSATIQNYFADFSIYPNPASDILIISNSNELDRVQIINIFGSIVLNQDIKLTTGEIDLSSVNPGVYFINIYSNNQHLVRKVTVK